VVDDHPIVREGLRLLFDLEGVIVCGEAESAPIALQQILTLKPDVVLVDLALRIGSGLDLIKQLRAQRLPVKLLVYTMNAETIHVERALHAGADGYLTKEEGGRKVVEAIRAVMEGKRFVGATVSPGIVAHPRAPQSARRGINILSDRELEVFEMLGNGLGTRAIAGKLGLSMGTITAHREHIKTKLRLRSADELLSSAFRWVHGDSAQPRPRSN